MHPTQAQVEDEATPLLAGQPRSLKGNTMYIYLVAGLSAIGGFLFGYDTGIVSGAMIFIRDDFALDEWWQEAIVSSTILAAWVFSILSASATDKVGRRPVIICSSVIFVCGSVVMAVATYAWELMIGRLIVGAGVGLASMTVPMYIAEVAPSGIRGQLVTINICCITFGQFFASVLAYAFSFVKVVDSWRLMLGFAALPAAIQFLCFLGMPESPRWLVSNHKYDEAKLVLKKLRPSDVDTDIEFEAIKDSCTKAQRELEASQEPQLSVFGRIMDSVNVKRALLVGCLLQLVQQLSGINTVMYYSASIFEMSGASKKRALLLASATAFVNFIFTLVGYSLVERAGRRKLTLFSLFGVFVSLLVLGSGFQFAYINSPKVTQVNNATWNVPCNKVSDCSMCSRQPECGFCFQMDSQTNKVSWATCLHVNDTHHDRSSGTGKCSIGTQESDTNTSSSSSPAAPEQTWAYEWCPSAYSWVTLMGMTLYLVFFAPGMGPMPWTVNSEIYPSWARSWCLSASTSIGWMANLLISMTFLSLTRAMTKHGAFYLYASFAGMGFVFFLLKLPETKGKTLEELETLFADKKQDTSNKSIEQSP